MHRVPLIAVGFDGRSAISRPSRWQRSRQGASRTAPGQDPLRRLVGNSPAVRRLRARIVAVAARDVRTLIVGPTGTGKDLVAHAIHTLSSRARGPFVAVNCAAVPHELIESTLFGYDRGAFTGAVTGRRGVFELADGGTIFLDEIAELAPHAQAKLLRVLDAPTFRRVGGEAEITTDVRILAASNQNLRQRVVDGQLRADLFHRLDIVTVSVPSLAERREDIPDLVALFLRELSAEQVSFGPSAIAQLRSHAWPGNIRELRSVIERALVFAGTDPIDTLEVASLDDHSRSSEPPSIATAIRALSAAFAAAVRNGTPVPNFRDAIEQSLAETAMQLAQGNKTAAAGLLSMDRKALARRLRQDKRQL